MPVGAFADPEGDQVFARGFIGEIFEAAEHGEVTEPGKNVKVKLRRGNETHAALGRTQRGNQSFVVARHGNLGLIDGAGKRLDAGIIFQIVKQGHDALFPHVARDGHDVVRGDLELQFGEELRELF